MTHAREISAAIKVRAKSAEMEGVVYAEVYLPIDFDALLEFEALVAARVRAEGISYDEAVLDVSASQPELADRALRPIDSQGEFMRAHTVQALAELWMRSSRAFDTDHNRQATEACWVIGSFVNDATIASPSFWPGAWVVVFRFDKASAEWASIVSGERQAVSFMAWTADETVTIRVEEVP